MKLHDVLQYLACPDCAKELKFVGGNVVCTGCNRRFYHKGNLIDLLPRKPLKLESVHSKKARRMYYLDQYRKAANEIYQNPVAWGRDEDYRKGHKIFIEEEERFFHKLYEGKKTVLCDLSASAGFYTIRASKVFKYILHCDINLEHLQYAQKKAGSSKISNMLFVRSDYFRLPLKDGVIDTFICTDSFQYYGRDHDLKVINRVYKKLSKGGKFIFDLHYKRFYGRSKYNFEYSKQDISFIKEKYKETRVYPMGRVPTFFHPSRWIFRLSTLFFWLPPLRYVCVIAKQERVLVR